MVDRRAFVDFSVIDTVGEVSKYQKIVLPQNSQETLKDSFKNNLN
jgi:hypothetical protein